MNIVDFHRDAVPGDFVWVFYPEIGFELHKVEQVSKTSIWCNGGRYNAKTGNRLRMPGFITGTAGKIQHEWRSNHQMQLLDAIAKIDDVSVLKKIARIVGYSAVTGY